MNETQHPRLSHDIPSHARLTRSIVFVVAFALMLAGVALQPAQADPDVPDPSPNESATAVGASTDTESIIEAASDYEQADASTAAALAEAASAVVAAPMTATEDGFVSESVNGAEVSVDDDGDVSLTVPTAPEIGLAAAGESKVELADGALVQTDVTTDTDVVTRATDFGVQIVAILASEEASNEVEFMLDLPEETELIEHVDGSIEITGPVEVEVIAPGEAERIDREFDVILGPDFDYENPEMTPEQLAEIEAIEPAGTIVIEEVRSLGEIAAPWAVDANGQPLDTHYVLDGEVLRQVIETDETTSYPVVADPSFGWYVKKAASCIVSVVFFASAAAKIAQASARIYKAFKAGKAGSSARKAYNAWLNLGSNNSQRMSNLVWNTKAIAELVRKHGITVARQKINAAGGMRKSTLIVITSGASTIADATGLSACVSVVTGRNY